MTKAKGHILPFFIPHAGCPEQCVFCDQKTISGFSKPPSREEIWAAMTENQDKNCELAFYGGSFTAMPTARQLYYLEIAQEGLKSSKIKSVRISTRPDYIDEEIINRLRMYGVQTVELGVQSMNDRTLVVSRRGHSAEDSITALKMLKAAGFVTGVQLMPGLPQDTVLLAVKGAAEILALRPDLLRIYPTVVVEGTALAEMYKGGKYQPLSLEQAVQVAAAITFVAEKYGVKVIRTGLNPDKNLAAAVLAGPYHPAFGNLVKSYIWRQKVLCALNGFVKANLQANVSKVSIYVAKSNLPPVFGQNADNRLVYESSFPDYNLKIKSFNNDIKADNGDVVITGGGKSFVLTEKDFCTSYLKKYGNG